MSALPSEAPPVSSAVRGMRRLEYLPRTFRQMGAIVPFTTRILSQARIRLGEARRASGQTVVEAMLPGFAGGNSIYVTTIHGLSEIVSMSVHDRALTERITLRRAHRPQEIMRCWIEVAELGLAGAEASQAAQRWNEETKRTIHNDRIVMVQRIAQRRQIELPQALVEMLRTSKHGEAALLQTIRDIEDGGGTRTSAMGQNLLLVSDHLAGIGLRSSPVPGHLRDLIWRLGELVTMLHEWGHRTMSDFGPSALACGDAASASYQEAVRSLERLDNMTRDIPALLSHWPKGKSELQAEIDRLYWILDGWSYIIDKWQEVVARTTSAEEAILEIYRVLPVIPQDEVVVSDTDNARTLRRFDPRAQESPTDRGHSGALHNE